MNDLIRQCALLALCLGSILLLGGCANDQAHNTTPVTDNNTVPAPDPTLDDTMDIGSIDPPVEPQPAARYRIGAFNLHRFGPARLEKPAAMDAIVKILQRYELVVLMEVTDASGNAAAELLSQLNASGDKQYDMLLSSRMGRASNYKEQYIWLYQLDRVAILDSFEYEDGIEPTDDFEREPLVIYADLGGLTLSLIPLHADPENVSFELNRLRPVYNTASLRWGDADSLLLGDFNADCSYLNEYESLFVNLFHSDDMHVLIDDEMDTTTGATDCAYDRIVSSHSLTPDIVSASPYNFQQALSLDATTALEVSDHYPVEIMLQAN